MGVTPRNDCHSAKVFRRIIMTTLLFFGLSLLSFVLPLALPADERAKAVSADEVRALRAKYHEERAACDQTRAAKHRTASGYNERSFRGRRLACRFEEFFIGILRTPSEVSGLASYAGADNCQELFRLQARPADKRTVYVRLPH